MTATWPAFGQHPWKLNAHPPAFRAFVLRVIDGDTYDCLVDQGFGSYTRRTIRLRGLDTPGTRRPEAADDAEIVRGLAAAAFARTLLEGRAVVLTTYSDPQTFERFVADVALVDRQGDVTGDVATILRAEGHAT